MENSTFIAKSGQAKRAACIVPTCKHLVWNKREQIGNEKGDRAEKITVRKVENSTALEPTAAGGCETLQLLRISQNSCPSRKFKVLARIGTFSQWKGTRRASKHRGTEVKGPGSDL